MVRRIRLNFILSLDSDPQPLELWKYETVRCVKNHLRKRLSCQTDWTPQQVHYNVTLYNQYYQELPDEESLVSLVNSGLLCNEDDIYIILDVDSGRFVDAIDTITRYLRKICIGLRPMTVREDPNHNYMFTWSNRIYTPPKTPELPKDSGAPPCVARPTSPLHSASQLLSQDDDPPELASSYLYEEEHIYHR
jgi:hypothetical protein